MTVTEQALVPADEEQRLAAVRRYAILDTPPDGAFDRVTALAARLFGTPIATVTIVDENRIWFKAKKGLPDGVEQTGRVPGLCASAILHDTLYVVADALRDPRTAANPLVHGEPGVRFYAAAPITTRDGHRLGTVNILDTRPRSFEEADLAALGDLAAIVMDELEMRRSAMRTVALERELRARVEAERTRLARLANTLQRTLLPPALPEVPGLEVAAHYRIASADRVGGDFYDLFPLADGRWAFFVGDVCGKGSRAAALTSLTRYTLRAAATYDPDPLEVLKNLNTVLQHEYQDGDARYCTALFGLLSGCGGPEGVEVTLAGGGHPPAYAIRGDGTVESVHPAGGQLIGLLPDARFAVTRLRLSPGDTLLLYTDGLSEARTPDGAMLGEGHLPDLLSGLAGASAPAVVASLRDLLAQTVQSQSDDTALLVLAVPAAGAATTTTATAAAAAGRSSATDRSPAADRSPDEPSPS
ncbi:SpoIIE family protein phosphatase [Streptomyces sp. SCUT-3]|uniref:PP2C family protein-serine/threonine phosphatase n=1 Tax=Streptomyces sp. SCUT-3 TaxID=2684469 RepID=UPI000CCB467B|nr:GAF domain-containing SpoIIE family protein phosphatase [Streptomyces sp. SCUT-3]PLW71209.1 hypothetical protein C0036_19035 [Streptomyces sp. DJ]QMV21208.1 SpoIIE family protein phosphatase [Streptomyces sp. SCUT-3]